MPGLIRNHYYKIVSNLKILLIFIFLTGVSILIFSGGEEMPLFAFLCLSVIGFPFISSIGLRRNNNSKWNQYILSLPVKRCEIVKSVFATQGITILIGSMLSVILFLTSFVVYGFAFYRYVDVVLLFSSTIGISLIMNAIFLPISYFDSNDRTEAMSIISLIISVALMVGLIAVINILIKKPTDMQLMIFAIGNLVLSIAAFLISYFLAVSIYSKKDC